MLFKHCLYHYKESIQVWGSVRSFVQGIKCSWIALALCPKLKLHYHFWTHFNTLAVPSISRGHLHLQHKDICCGTKWPIQHYQKTALKFYLWNIQIQNFSPHNDHMQAITYLPTIKRGGMWDQQTVDMSVCEHVHAHACVCNQFSWSIMWISCHWRPTPLPLLHFLTISNNMDDWQTWEVEAALLLFTLQPSNDIQ